MQQFLITNSNGIRGGEQAFAHEFDILSDGSHRRNLMGYEGYWYPDFLDSRGTVPSTFRDENLLSTGAICGD